MTPISTSATWNIVGTLVADTSLRELRKHSIVRDTLNELNREKLAAGTATLVDATPLLARELIALAMDSRNKPYSRVNAMALSFQTVKLTVSTNRNKSRWLS